MRVKRGENKRAKHKKVLQLAKGYRMTYHKLYRRAKEAVRHAGQYSYAHRKHRASQMRTEWIKIINSKLFNTEYSYSKFMNLLKTNNIVLDRKNLAEMIINTPEKFELILKEVSAK